MDIYVFKLKFNGATHFGDTGIELENVNERINSDTLFSALVNTVNILYGSEKASEFANSFLQNPPFVISSLFIYRENTFYFPKPLTDDHLAEEFKKDLGKELKKISWLSQDMFLKWISGKKLEAKDIELIKNNNRNYKNSYTIEIRPRVSIDRNTNSTNLYHCGYVYFKKDAGLFGFVAFKDQKMIDFFKNLLTDLGNIGLGGEKTYGSGFFDVIDFSKINNTFLDIFNTQTSQYVLLSLYHPSKDELDAFKEDLIAYDLLRKKGWISSGRHALPVKRKSAGFIIEGSVLRFKPTGCLINVTPDTYPNNFLKHSVYKYGYAFTAPFGG
ncbi:MAG TPA: type III-A CRISPR-associated RAMP protein Csm4 [Caldisericia bacterium]|nr:type III-A CRISPR-associated RAMP protein Csm4 [Caldisericia bacterium]